MTDAETELIKPGADLFIEVSAAVARVAVSFALETKLVTSAALENFISGFVFIHCPPECPYSPESTRSGPRHLFRPGAH